MEKKHQKEINKEKISKISNQKIIFNQKNNTNVSYKIPDSKNNIPPKTSKKETNSKLITNKTLTDWNKRKIYKRIIQNAPGVPKLYLKKRVDSKNKNNLINPLQKMQLSCAHKKIEKYTKKVIYDSKNLSLSKKKKISKNNLKNSENENETEKDAGFEDETIPFNAPHMTGKKNYNYFFGIPQTEMKEKNNKKSINNAFDEFDEDKNNKNKPEIFHRAKRYVINKKNNFQNNNHICENRYNESEKNRNITRNKSSKDKEDNKKSVIADDINKYNKYNHNYQNNIVIHNFNNNSNFKKDHEINQLNHFFCSLKTNREAKVNKIVNLHPNHSIISQRFKIKKNNLNLNNFQLASKRKELKKNINFSYINNTKDNTYYIGNKTSIKNSSSDFISAEETKDSPENITDKEDDKFNLSIHKINNFFINDIKIKKKEKSGSKYNKNYLFLNLDLDIDENCIAHKANISIVNPHNSNGNISSYKKNMERFKNLTTEKKMPVSLFLSPTQKNNLFNNERNKIKNINYNNNNMKKNKFIDLLINRREKKDNRIKMYIEKYLDFESLLQLSSVNRILYKHVRFFLFKYIYKKSIGSNTNKNEQKLFISKVITTIYKYSQIKIKSRKELKNIYSLYKSKSKYDSEILKDLTRTFPKDKSFSKGSKNYKKLYNILTSYSNYNKNIGYAQGLNFIAANTTLIFESEEISFLFLDGLINRFELKNYISVDNKNLVNKLGNFSKYLNKYTPDIISFLEKNDINHGFFSHGWILTLFSNSMKLEYLIPTWAFMIIFGWKFFYSFVIQILLWYKKEIFKANINKLCYKMKNILSDDEFGNNYKNIIKNTFSFMNKNIVL